MDFVPGPVACTKCGRTPTSIFDFRSCTLCSAFLCGEHAVTRNGVDTCEACVPRRARREAASGVSDADEASVIERLRADVLATIGGDYDAEIISTAAHRRLYPYPVNPSSYVPEVVDGVQQFFHDAFVDTSWPACPLHPNHPLWFSDGWWYCEKTKTRIAALGALSAVMPKK